MGNSPVSGEFPTQSQWRGAFRFSLICAWIKGWVNNRKADDLRRRCVHYDVIVMDFHPPRSATTVSLVCWLPTACDWTKITLRNSWPDVLWTPPTLRCHIGNSYIASRTEVITAWHTRSLQTPNTSKDDDVMNYWPFVRESDGDRRMPPPPPPPHKEPVVQRFDNLLLAWESCWTNGRVHCKCHLRITLQK